MIKRPSGQKSPKSHEVEEEGCLKGNRHFCDVPHHPLQFGTVRRVSDDVVLRGCDAQEVQVIGALGAARGLLRLIAIQQPHVILTQQGVVYRQENTRETTSPLQPITASKEAMANANGCDCV